MIKRSPFTKSSLFRRNTYLNITPIIYCLSYYTKAFITKCVKKFIFDNSFCDVAARFLPNQGKNGINCIYSH